MRIAMVGTRGVPAAYSGFETCVEEVGRRLVERGHEVVVYCRGERGSGPATYLGMELVHLPALKRKVTETLSHTAVSTAHLVRHPVDVCLVFNAANAPLVPVLRGRGMPTAVHVDGLEWARAKWEGLGQTYYRRMETLSVRVADELIADAHGIQQYYRDTYGVDSAYIPYGAPVLQGGDVRAIADLGVPDRGYHLVVARFEPENHVLEIVRGYHASGATLPLLVVGGAPYSADYTQAVAAAAEGDPRIRLLGRVDDQHRLDTLYACALTYLHGHSVGGTNPSLLRAMGAGAAVIAWDVVFNREVLGDTGAFAGDEAAVGAAVEAAERDRDATVARGAAARDRAAATYRWDDVTDGYEALCQRLLTRRRRPRDAARRRSTPRPAAGR